MRRISRQLKFMKQAEAEAQRSTCFRGGVGAVLVLNNNIISSGYNGPPSGEPHCMGNECPLSDHGTCSRSNHAEMNAYNRAPIMSSLDWQKTTLYCTHQPCANCAEEIIIHKTCLVIFMHPYHSREGLNRLLAAGIGVIRITPSDYLIDVCTNEIIRHETK